MAFDTVRDRATVVSVASVWQPPSVVGGSAFDQNARWQIGWSYLAGGVVPPAAGGGVYLWYRRRRRIKRPPHQ